MSTFNSVVRGGGMKKRNDLKMIGTNNRTEKLNKTVRHRQNLRLFT